MATNNKPEIPEDTTAIWERVKLMITSKKEQRLYDEIERSLHGIEKHEFPARPLEPARCPTCPFFFICPA